LGPAMRLDAIFVALCMALIAASAGAVTYLIFGVSVLEAATVAVAAGTALALYNTVAWRRSVQSGTSDQLAHLSRGSSELARQVAEMGRRLAAVEGRVETTFDKARSAT